MVHGRGVKQVKHCLTFGEELRWAMKDDSRLHTRKLLHWLYH
jgi:hypothetical protein